MISSSSSSSFLLSLLVWLPLMTTAVRNVRIASPLQTLTLWDKPEPTRRGRFLPKFRAGLKAETAIHQAAAAQKQDELQQLGDGKNWAQQAATADRQRKARVERAAERAFEQAFAAAEAQEDSAATSHTTSTPPRSSKYQFVGVVNPRQRAETTTTAPKPPITWYARPKPAASTWSVRLVHVNRQAILYDLFRRGKVDLFARYKNQGNHHNNVVATPQQAGVTTRQPVVKAEYLVRERSWKNLWNFSPKHMFTDSSGMYWRERRLRPGLYTDGQNVYEASYRYTDGRNGMYRKSSLQQYLDSPKVAEKQKKRILERLEKDTPDLVLEE